VEVAGSVVARQVHRGRRCAPGSGVPVFAPPESRHLAGSLPTTKAPPNGEAFVGNRDEWRWRESNSAKPAGYVGSRWLQAQPVWFRLDRSDPFGSTC
jgi:hypothetical protein